MLPNGRPSRFFHFRTLSPAQIGCECRFSRISAVDYPYGAVFVFRIIRYRTSIMPYNTNLGPLCAWRLASRPPMRLSITVTSCPFASKRSVCGILTYYVACIARRFSYIFSVFVHHLPHLIKAIKGEQRPRNRLIVLHEWRINKQDTFLFSPDVIFRYIPDPNENFLGTGNCQFGDELKLYNSGVIEATELKFIWLDYITLGF